MLTLLVMNSCDSFVDVDLPKSQLTSQTVFEDYATADAALTDVYAKIRDKGMLTGTNSGLSNELGNYADELEPYGSASNPSVVFFKNIILPSTPDIAEYWNSGYNQIYAVNSILEGVNQSTHLSSTQKKQLQGEALFIRGLIHFYLLNLYGDIPYIKETDYRKNSIVTRMPDNEVYQDIITDVKNAADMLQENYSSEQRVRPNRYTAKALLSRIYLYSGDYQGAEQEASSILNQSQLYILTADLDQVFLIGSQETIWQLQANADGQNSQEGDLFIFLSGPPPMVALNNILINSFSMQDLRRSKWIKTVTNNNGVWYHSYKYKEQNFTPVSKEYSIIFRLAEQYLIRAEARAQLGDYNGAKQDLNIIRERAGLSDTIALSKEEILQAILQERRWEFFTELGHRFFDLKRSGQLDNVLMPSKNGWNSTDRLFPIPQNELSTNPNLRPQNPGY